MTGQAVSFKHAPVPVLAVPMRDARGPAASAVPRTFLVADDNRDGADTLSMVLRLSGGEVVTAYDGDAAVQAFADARAGVVLLDIWMPRRSGYDACRAIRQLPGGREALIVAVTGWGEAQDRQRSLEAGFDAHLVKPLDHQSLLAWLHDHERTSS